MEQRDFLMREIERLSQILSKLISKVSGLKAVDFQVIIKEVNDTLYTEFDLNLDSIIAIDKPNLLAKIKDTDRVNLELLTSLLAQIIEKIQDLEKQSDYDIAELSKKAIVLIEYIDEHTKTFSMERMNLKKKLELI